MVYDRVERHVFVFQVSLGWFHVVSAVVALYKALKLTICDGAMSQSTFLTWKIKTERLSSEDSQHRTKVRGFHNKQLTQSCSETLKHDYLRCSLTIDFTGVDMRGVIRNFFSRNIYLQIWGKQCGVPFHP